MLRYIFHCEAAAFPPDYDFFSAVKLSFQLSTSVLISSSLMQVAQRHVETNVAQIEQKFGCAYFFHLLFAFNTPSSYASLVARLPIMPIHVFANHLVSIIPLFPHVLPSLGKNR
jgi:hypothetical protein